MDKAKQQDRRGFLKQCGLGAAAVSMFASRTTQAVSRRRPSAALTTDVLVVGGGPAGIGAAIGAAKAGAKTLVLEDQAYAFAHLALALHHVEPADGGAPRGWLEQRAEDVDRG